MKIVITLTTTETITFDNNFQDIVLVHFEHPLNLVFYWKNKCSVFITTTMCSYNNTAIKLIHIDDRFNISDTPK